VEREDICKMIRRLQEAEKEKLASTAQIQILTIQAMEGDKDYDETIQQHKTRYKMEENNCL
jgi:DNA-binding XRE family transcriptional regulator